MNLSRSFLTLSTRSLTLLILFLGEPFLLSPSLIFADHIPFSKYENGPNMSQHKELSPLAEAVNFNLHF